MKKLINVLFTANIFIMLVLLLFFKESADYYLKRDFLMSDLKLLAVSLIIFLPAAFLVYHNKKRLSLFLERRSKWLFPLALFVLFVSEAVFAVSGFFYSDWDPAGVLSAAFSLYDGKPGDVSYYYFSAHPNNLMLVLIYYRLLKCFSFLTHGLSIYPILLFQCLLFTLSGALIYSIAKHLSGSFIIAWTAFILYVLVIGCSPWLIITYSDEVGLIFPLIILRLWLFACDDHQNKLIRCLLFFIIGLLSSFGYSVKPQIVIVTIAILLISLTDTYPFNKQSVRSLSGIVFPVISGMVVMSCLISFILIPSMKIHFDKAQAFPMTHYFMMGLNDATDGVYNDADGDITNSIEDPHDKRLANIEISKQRLREYGFTRLMKHLAKKSMVNYGDGTFSYGIDGNFFAGKELSDFPPVKETILSPAVNELILPQGNYFELISAIRHAIWLLILTLCFVTGIISLISHSERNTYFRVIFLSVLGITLFELMFEAKARYLFVYVPFYLLSAIGSFSLYEKTYK